MYVCANLLLRIFFFDVSWYSILLFKNGTVLKLCDFGTAKKLEHTLTNAVGTIRYMAPEVIRGVFMGGLILVSVAYVKSITGQKKLYLPGPSEGLLRWYS